MSLGRSGIAIWHVDVEWGWLWIGWGELESDVDKFQRNPFATISASACHAIPFPSYALLGIKYVYKWGYTS